MDNNQIHNAIKIYNELTGLIHDKYDLIRKIDNTYDSKGIDKILRSNDQRV